MVDRAALEMRSTCKRTGGSNPSLSAILLRAPRFAEPASATESRDGPYPPTVAMRRLFVPPTVPNGTPATTMMRSPAPAKPSI